MKLRSKLILAFGTMLLLVAAIATSAWFSMGDMDRMAKQLAAVDNSMFALQRAQLANLRFINYKEIQYANEAKEAIAVSKSYLQTARQFIKAPSQMALAETAVAGVNSFEKIFLTLIENSNKGTEITKKMAILDENIATTATNTLRFVEKSTLENYTENRFKAFSILNQSVATFNLMRTHVLEYQYISSDASAKKALELLALARSYCVTAEQLFVVEANKAAAKQVLTALDAYRTLFQEYIAINSLIAKSTDEARIVGTQVADTCTNLSDAAEKLISTSAQNGNTTNMLVLLVAAILGIGITIVLTRNVLSQLGKDPSDLATIANRVSNGDFNIDDGSPRVGVYDNIVRMVATLKEHIENAQHAAAEAKTESARAVEAMKAADLASADAQAKRDSILAAADKLEEVANVVSSAAEELSAQIEQSERGAAEQAGRVGETATAMEEMNATVLEVARNAASANAGGTAMRDKALAGAAVVDSSVNGVQKARADALALKEDMNALSEQAQSIGQIMNVISDIADQTNLLALNAAIEAARAGEAGRGFAVVADEVRKLAEKTMQSTTDVGNAIRTIQASATKNMAQVDATVKNIEFSTEEAEKSGQALREIVEMVDIAVAQVSSIATASEEQSATSEEINNSIAQVNTIATETARAMQEAAQAVSDLSHQAQVLTRLIEDMKKD